MQPYFCLYKSQHILTKLVLNAPNGLSFNAVKNKSKDNIYGII